MRDYHEQLVQKASSLFILAATACWFVHEEDRRFAESRVDMILKGSSTSVIAPYNCLNEIYNLSKYIYQFSPPTPLISIPHRFHLLFRASLASSLIVYIKDKR
jgi:hypothetical protein